MEVVGKVMDLEGGQVCTWRSPRGVVGDKGKKTKRSGS